MKKDEKGCWLEGKRQRCDEIQKNKRTRQENGDENEDDEKEIEERRNRGERMEESRIIEEKRREKKKDDRRKKVEGKKLRETWTTKHKTKENI